MKKITFKLLLLMLGIVGHSQTTLWSTDCEDYATADYIVSDIDGDGYGFAPIDYGDMGGPTDIKFFSESWNSGVGALNPDNWLFSPEVTFANDTEAVTISAEVFAQDTQWPAEKFSIGLYDLVLDTDYVFHTEVLTSADNVDSPKTVSVTIGSTETDFSGLTLRMYVRHFDCPNNFRFIVDNMSVSTSSSASMEDYETKVFKAFPNPVANMLTIQGNLPIEQVEVFNQLGQSVLTVKENAMQNNQIDLSRLNAGIYFVQITSKTKTETLRVVNK